MQEEYHDKPIIIYLFLLPNRYHIFWLSGAGRCYPGHKCKNLLDCKKNPSLISFQVFCHKNVRFFRRHSARLTVDYPICFCKLNPV